MYTLRETSKVVKGVIGSFHIKEASLLPASLSFTCKIDTSRKGKYYDILLKNRIK